MIADIVQAHWLDLRTWSWGGLAAAIVIVCGLIALVAIAMRALKIVPPPWFIEALWVIVIVAVLVCAIRLVASM